MAREQLVLPANVIGPADLARLVRQLEQYDDTIREANVRAKSSGKASSQADLPAGHLLQVLAEANDFDINDVKQRKELMDQLQAVLKVAPTVTVSFAVDPSAAFMVKIVGWFRSSIHPHVLVRTGLQPNIAAGFMLRTPSKVYDFSLRSKFAEQQPELLKRLRPPSGKAAV